MLLIYCESGVAMATMCSVFQISINFYLERQNLANGLVFVNQATLYTTLYNTCACRIHV